REVLLKVLMSPRDPVEQAFKGAGPTNYLYNDQVFYLNSALKLTDITDGTSNTVFLGETLKGDGEKKAVTVQRQHVLLTKADLPGLKDDAGVKPWKAGKNIAADRCHAWIDGRFLQGTFNGRLKLNDTRPDVSCEGAGGVSALRTLDKVVLVG